METRNMKQVGEMNGVLMLLFVAASIASFGLTALVLLFINSIKH